MSRFKRLTGCARWGLVALLGATVASPLGGAAQSGAGTLPSLELDDPARLVRPGELPGTEDLVVGYGAVFGPLDFVTLNGTEPPEAGPFADLDVEERVELLDDLGWLSTAQLNMGITDEDDPANFSAYLQTSVTRFSSAREAEDAFDVLEDESDYRDVEDEDAPREFGSPSEVTVASDAQRVNRNLTFVVGDSHVNVFVVGEEDDEVFNEDLLFAAGELLAERLEADVEELPGLAPLVLRVASDGQTTFTYESEYQSLDGDTPRDTYDDDEEFEVRSEQWRDMEHVYSYLGGFSPDGSVVSRIYQAEDEDAAEALMEELEGNPAPGFYATWELLDDAPELGDASLAAEFTYALGEDEYQGYAVVFRVGEVVARVEIDASEDVGADVVVELAEAQLACIEDGGCEPFELPADLSGGGSDDEEDPLGPVDEQEA